MKNNLKIYVQHRNNEILGGMLTTDDKQGLGVIVANVVSDLSRCEAEIISLSSVNRNARNYAENVIKSGNSAYAELKQKENPG